MIKDNGQGKYYIYRHIRVDNNEVFYIGLGTKPKQRTKLYSYNEQYRRSQQLSIRSDFWKRIINKTEYIIEILCESDDYKFIEQKEKEFIKLQHIIDLHKGQYTIDSMCNKLNNLINKL